MKTIYFKAWIRKMRWSFIIIPLMFALPVRVLAQVAVRNPVCRPEPIQLICNFPDACSNPGATFSWHNTSGSWTTHVKNPVLFPTGYPVTGDGQTTNGYGYCNGEGYATDYFYLTVTFSPPPGGSHSGSVHVMENSGDINISGTVKALNGTLLSSGTAYMYNTKYGVLDTVATTPVNSGHFTFYNTCGADGSPILVTPSTVPQTMISTYLGDTPSWSDATAIVATASMILDTIHMIAKPSPIQGSAPSIIKGNVYKVSHAKANDPIDNVGIIIKHPSVASLSGYSVSGTDGSFRLGHFEEGDYSITSDYPGIPMYTANGANIVKVYNPLDTINLTVNVVADSIMVDSNIIRVYPAYVVSPSCSVQDEFLSSGVTKCYDALHNLTVSGSQSVVVHNGGTATFIAGQKITFKPGFKVESGGSARGFITTTGQFCSQVFGSNLSPGDMTIAGGNNDCFLSGLKMIIYPNPTPGSFTLELPGEQRESTVAVSCYNNMGSLVMENEFHSGKKHELSLAGYAPGIYLLRVSMNGEAGLRKIVKQ